MFNISIIDGVCSGVSMVYVVHGMYAVYAQCM